MRDRVGNVALCADFWDGTEPLADASGQGAELLQLVSVTPEADFPRLITEHPSWHVLYHLSPLRQNLINWFPFSPGQSVLEIGAACGAVTGAFLGRGLRVTGLEPSPRRCEINATRHSACEGLTLLAGRMQTALPALRQRFDHVTLFFLPERAPELFADAADPLAAMLCLAASVLAQGGSLWVAVRNRLGLKYFAGCPDERTGRFFDGPEGYPDPLAPRALTRRELLNAADQAHLDCEVFYPYPDAVFPVKIFSDAYPPRPGELNRNWQSFDRDRLSLFDESRVFDTLMEEGLFSRFSNAFLVRMRKKVTG